MDAITSVAPLLACTFNTSLSFIIKGSVNTCSFSLADKLTLLSIINILELVSTKVTLVDAAAAVFVVDNNVSLSANEKEQVLTEPLIMKESEALKVQASSGQTDVIASILEINREDR